MELMMEVAAALAGANVIVLLPLIYIYARITLHSKAVHSVGLLIFGLLLLSHNFVTVFAYVTMAPLFGAEALPFLSGMAAFELAGLLVLLRLTI